MKNLSTKAKARAIPSTRQEYIAKAARYSGGLIKNKDALIEIAFNLQKDDSERAAQEKENEKEKAVAMVAQEKEKEIEHLRAFYLKKLSFISQRLVLRLSYKFTIFLRIIPRFDCIDMF